MATTSPSPSTCEICSAPAPEAAHELVHGVRLCLPCANATNDPRLEGLGYSFDRVTTHRNRSGSIFAAHVSRTAQLDLQVKFRREGFTSRLLAKLGQGDLEIGETEFDDAVLIEVEDHHRAAVTLLLQDAVVRGAVLSMLAHTRLSVVEICNGMVSGSHHGGGTTWPFIDGWIRDALIINWRIAQQEKALREAW